MFWKVEYEKDGQTDCMFYGGKTTTAEKDRRNEKLIQEGFKIISCHKVKDLK